MRPLLTALVIVLCVPSLRAQTKFVQPQLTADQSRSTTEATVWTGHARLDYEGATLTADEIAYDPRQRKATAKGQVILTRGNRRLLAEELTYGLEDQSLTVKNLRLGEHPIYISGQEVAGTPERLTLTNAELTYTEPGPFTPTLAAERLTYYDGDRIEAERVRLGLGDFRPIPLTVFTRSVGEPLLSQVSGTAGYGRRLGLYTEIKALAPVASGLDLGGGLGYYTARGLLAGPAAAYESTTADGRLLGELRTGYIHDHGERLTDILGRPVPKDRGFVGWTHRQNSGERFSMTADVNYWSDSEVMRDFRAEEFFEVQTPDTFVEAAYSGDNYIISAFTRFQPNSYHAVQERLPELRFDLLPLEVGLGVYERGNASLVALREEFPGGGLEREVNRIDAYYGLSRPWNPRSGVSVTPVVGGRMTHYSSTVGNADDYTRMIGEVGFDARLQASGVYDYRNAAWGIDGLRHLVTPGLSYRYAPEAGHGRGSIVPIDREVFSTYLQPLGLADVRNIDDLRGLDTLRLSLENVLQTRDKVYGSRDLARLGLAADWQLDEPAGSDDFSDLHLDFALMPAPWLEWAVYQRFDAETGTPREVGTGLTVRDADVWALQFSNHYLENELEEYGIDYRYRVNEVYSVLARLRYDAVDSRLVEQSYALQQNLQNLWTVRYGIELREGSRRESSFGFSLTVELASF